MSAAKEEWVHQLYLQHAPDLYRIAKYRLQDPDTAYDLTQEVFLTLLSKTEVMRKHPNPAGWLRLTLRNKLNHEFARRTTRSRHEVPETELAWLPAPWPGDGKTLDELLPRQLSQQLRQDRKMSEEQVRKNEEMSKRLAIPPAT